MSQDRTRPIVHVRENSDTELEALFNIAMNPQLASETNKSLPLRMRNLPASFFRPPEPPKQNMNPQQMGVNVGKDGHGTSDAPVFHGAVNSSVNIAHMRAHSSPASLTQPLSAAPPPPPTGHVRQHSYDLLDEQPLPTGWDMAKTPQGQRYYLNHVLQITTWQDPRKTPQPQAIANTNSNNNNNSTSNLNTSPQTGSPAPSSQPSPNSQPVNVDKVPLPPGWERAFTADMEVYFINHIDRTTSWFHPSIPAQLQKPGMRLHQQQQQQQAQQQQQQQQQQQLSSGPMSPQQEQLIKIQQLQMEKGLLKKRQDEIARQMALRAQVGEPLRASSGDLTAISSSSEMTSVSDPFFGQTTTSDHHRQESGDSGLGGMGTSYSLPRTPDDFLGNMEDMDTGDGGPKLAGQADFNSMDLAGVSDVGDHLNMDSDDLVPSLQEDISSDLLKEVETVLGNKDNNPLTWL